MRYKLRNNYSKDPNKALEEILLDRGVEDFYDFIHPAAETCELNPYNLDNIQKGAEMLLHHLRAGHNVLWNIDADCDGFTSSAILWLYCKQIFPQANFEFRVHEHKQHGLSDLIDWVEEKARWDLIVCPDSSSYDVEEHRRLGELGIDCLVLDHHPQEYDDNGNPITSNSPNTIVINNQLSPNYQNKSLCGAGIVYKFCEVLDEILGINQASNYLDLAALGEIADVMDRTTIETNYIMLEGLKNIQNKGFKTLIESQAFSLKDKAVAPYNGLTPIDIAFYIGPLINAITRVGSLQDKQALFYCFIEPDKELQSTKRGAKEGDTETAAEQAARVGKNAKSRQDKIKEKAMDLIDFKIQKNDLLQNNIILIELDEYDNIPQEMTGLIAMNVVSKYHKPCMIGRRDSKNLVQGSIRSDSNFAGLPSFKKFLEDSGIMEYVAGHAGAAGYGIAGNKIDTLLKYANTKLRAEDFENCYIVDYILNANDNNQELLTVLSQYPELFGNHIDEIKFVIKDISLSSILVMGANKDSIKISYNGIDYIKFKDEDFIEEVMNNRTKKLTVYGRANLNEWMGKKSVQVFITDYELTNDSNKYDF